MDRDFVKAVLEGVERKLFSVSVAMKMLDNEAAEDERKTKEPIAKCVGRDGNVEPEIALKLFGAEPSVGNEPMKETHIKSQFSDYKFAG